MVTLNPIFKPVTKLTELVTWARTLYENFVNAERRIKELEDRVTALEEA